MIARNMYLSEGLKSVRMDDVARAAGISKRTLYEEFHSKDELIFLAVKLHSNIFGIELDNAAQGASNILIAMLLVMDHIVKNSDNNWKLHSSVTRFFPKVAARLEEELEVNRQEEFRRALMQGVEEGVIVPRANLDMAMLMLRHMATSVVLESSELKLPDGVTPQGAFMEVVINMMRGIATTRGIEMIDNYLERDENKEEM